MEHIGDASPYDICREIMGLTKLNWNSCAFFNSSPITISFAPQRRKDINRVYRFRRHQKPVPFLHVIRS